VGCDTRSTATPMPAWTDPTIDLGIGVTGISFVLALLAAGLAMTSRLAGALNPISNDAVS
jgi:hypothetical protein